MKKWFMCPSFDDGCPYLCRKSGKCSLVNADRECDEFCNFTQEEIERFEIFNDENCEGDSCCY